MCASARAQLIETTFKMLANMFPLDVFISAVLNHIKVTVIIYIFIEFHFKKHSLIRCLSGAEQAESSTLAFYYLVTSVSKQLSQLSSSHTPTLALIWSHV